MSERDTRRVRTRLMARSASAGNGASGAGELLLVYRRAGRTAAVMRAAGSSAPASTSVIAPRSGRPSRARWAARSAAERAAGDPLHGLAGRHHLVQRRRGLLTPADPGAVDLVAPGQAGDLEVTHPGQPDRGLGAAAERGRE